MAERTKTRFVRKLVFTAVMAAVAFVLQLLEFPVPVIPSFVKLDFSELPALLCSFAYGGGYGVAVCLVKNLLKLITSSSAGIGELANFLLGAVFVLTAGLIYSRRKSRKTALIGSLSGAALSAAVCFPINWFIVYPFYISAMGFPAEAILGMYRAILPSTPSLAAAILIFNVPFTFLKFMISVGVAFLVYKYLSPILKGK